MKYEHMLDSSLCAPEPTQGTGFTQVTTRTDTHQVLVALVRSYIRLVRSEWPAVCRRDPDFSIEAAHNYGLGLIRMLAEFQVANGINDRESVQLALDLDQARRDAARSIKALGRYDESTVVRSGGCRWRRRQPKAIKVSVTS